VKKESNPHAHAEKDGNRQDGDGRVLCFLKIMPEVHASSDRKPHVSLLTLIRAAGSGGVPTEKEVEDYQERKRVDEREQWDRDFNYSEPGTAVDRLLEKTKK
jgi:hypothetical protein